MTAVRLDLGLNEHFNQLMQHSEDQLDPNFSFFHNGILFRVRVRVHENHSIL